MHIFNQGIRDWFPDLKMTIIKFCKDKTYCHGYTTSESLRRQWHESDVILGCFIGSSWSLFLSSDIVKDSQKIRFLTLPPVFLPFCVSIQVLNGSTAHDGPGNVPNRDPRCVLTRQWINDWHQKKPCTPLSISTQVYNPQMHLDVRQGAWKYTRQYWSIL